MPPPPLLRHVLPRGEIPVVHAPQLLALEIGTLIQRSPLRLLLPRHRSEPLSFLLLLRVHDLLELCVQRRHVVTTGDDAFHNLNRNTHARRGAADSDIRLAGLTIRAHCTFCAGELSYTSDRAEALAEDSSAITEIGQLEIELLALGYPSSWIQRRRWR